MQQSMVDVQNAAFWNELCGTWLAQSVGITDASPQSLRRYDAAYLALYPYLPGYVVRESLKGKHLLEIGLGYGTLGQLLSEQGCDYHGLDISEGPVAMMRHRLRQLGISHVEERVAVGSALAIPHEDSNFGYVYSIGCLHHTGNLRQAVSEIHRILKPGGKAIIMLYNRRSFRQFVAGSRFFIEGLWVKQDREQRMRALYDSNAMGDAAPHTDYVSKSEARQIFRQFSHIDIEVQNFDAIRIKGRRVIPRRLLLNNLARVVGLDLYITAVK